MFVALQVMAAAFLTLSVCFYYIQGLFIVVTDRRSLRSSKDAKFRTELMVGKRRRIQAKMRLCCHHLEKVSRWSPQSRARVLGTSLVVSEDEYGNI